jgi:hypothetical protein
MITGTCTCGINAVGQAMGATGEQVLEFHRQRGVRIFPRTGGVGSWSRTFRNLFMPEFSPTELRKSVGGATCQLRDRTQSPPTDRFHRVNYVAEPKLYKLDDA